MRIGLALSGGAARGIAHVGVLRALVENNIPIDAIAGASAGSLIGGCFAAGLSPERLEEIALAFRWRHTARIGRRFRLRRATCYRVRAWMPRAPPAAIRSR